MIVRLAAPLLVVSLMLASAGSVAAQEPTVEQRLERLERKVDLILQHLGIQPEQSRALVGNVHLMFGQPSCAGTLLPKQHFVICHRNPWRIPEWVTYHLSEETLQGSAERTDDFRPDPELPQGERAELSNYRNSGFDRGHMAPAADFKRSRVAMSETFLLSNMTPQTPNLNRGIWANLEDEVRSLARAHGRIWVFTGSLFLDANDNPAQPRGFIGTDRVAVPTHFYKVILCEHSGGNYEMFAFIIPNQRERILGSPRAFIATVDDVERLSGLDFFSGLPDDVENRLEAIRATNWPIH